MNAYLIKHFGRPNDYYNEKSKIQVALITCKKHLGTNLK